MPTKESKTVCLQCKRIFKSDDPLKKFCDSYCETTYDVLHPIR